MELLQLKYFCDAAETENLSQTARKFQVPVSNISQTIKRLERELGTELFSRRKNQVYLNEQGRIFYQGAQAALDKLEDTCLQMQDAQAAVAGEIRVLALTNRRILTRAIQRFKVSYPAVSFMLSHSRSAKDSDFDLIIADDRYQADGFQAAPLLREDILLALHRNHPLAEAKQIDLSRLRNERFITMSPGSSLHAITDSICRDAGFAPEIVIETDDPYYVRKYLEMGLGIAFVPSLTWKGEFSDEIVLKELDAMKRTTCVFLPDDRYLTRAVRLFAQMLSEAAETY